MQEKPFTMCWEGIGSHVKKEKEFLDLFPAKVREYWRETAKKIADVQEIRLRVNKPVLIFYQNKEFFMQSDGSLGKAMDNPYIVTQDEVEEILNHICNYSLYAYENELKQGYLTVEGGHRIGVAGRIILEQGKVKNIKHISYINIRISHQIIGAANKVLPYLYQNKELLNCLIISPPGGGKTTLLRDIVRQVSNGNPYGEGMNVSVVDERSEIGGSYLGVAQNDIGIRTDLLDACPKVEGMMMLIRAMAPKMLAIDELGSREDILALEQVLQCGCKIIATVHGNSIDDMKKKEHIEEIVKKKIFHRYIVLGNRADTGNILGVYNEELESCLN